MNLDKIIERKKAKNHIITEGMFNIQYIMNRAKDELNYENTLYLLDENQGRIAYSDLLKIVIETLTTSEINECQERRLKNRLSENVKYYKNIKNVKSVTERLQEKYKCDLECVIKEADILISADRILHNEAQLDKKFNLDKFISNYNVFSEEPSISLVEELCFKIDGAFKSPMDLKFNVAVENISFALYERGSVLEEDVIVETISRYFDLAGANVEKILNQSSVVNEKTKISVFNKLHKKSASKVKELISKIKNIETPQQVKNIIRVMYSQSAQQVLDDIPNFLTWIRTFIMFSTVAINPYLGCVVLLADQFVALTVKQKEADKMIKQFKDEKEKCEKKLDRLKSDKARENLEKYIDTLDKSINKLESYRDSIHGEKEDDYSMDEMTQEMKDMSDVMNEGRFNYTPFTMTKQCFKEKYFTEVTNQFNKIQNCLKNYSRPSVIKENVTVLNNNFERYPLNYLSDNGNIYIPVITLTEMSDVARNSLVKTLNSSLNKNYKLIEEDANDGIVLNLYSEYAIKTTNNIHMNVLEAYDQITSLEESLKTYNESIETINKGIVDYIKNSDVEDTVSICKLSSFGEAFNTRDIKDVLNERLDESYDNNDNASIKVLNKSLNVLKESHDIYANNIVELSEGFDALRELIDMSSESDYMTEGKLRNSALMAREKLKKSAARLSDKDKIISNKIDNYVDNIMEKSRRGLTNKNREAVIKGSILPSASAALKLGLASIATLPINPLISIIILVGGLGASKIGTAREKQYIMDEIEVELKLVDKKIQLAERNDDTKSLEKLYRIEKQLKREKTRILYNKKNYRPVEKDR